jgi:hypothetical protein
MLVHYVAFLVDLVVGGRRHDRDKDLWGVKTSYGTDAALVRHGRARLPLAWSSVSYDRPSGRRRCGPPM